MSTICYASDCMKCEHKKPVDKVLTLCKIDADREKCVFARTKSEVIQFLEDVE